MSKPVVTEAMIAAYLAANTAYWHEVDAMPRDITKSWRQGTPSDATRVSLEAALRAAPTAKEAPALEPLTDWQVSDICQKWLDTPGTSFADLVRAGEAAHGITPSAQAQQS